MTTRQISPGRRRRRAGMVAILAAVVLVGAIATYVLWAASGPSAGGVARLAVDRSVVDFGDVPYDRFVTATFQVTNTGSGRLTLDASAPVWAVQGC